MDYMYEVSTSFRSMRAESLTRRSHWFVSHFQSLPVGIATRMPESRDEIDNASVQRNRLLRARHSDQDSVNTDVEI